MQQCSMSRALKYLIITSLSFTVASYASDAHAQYRGAYQSQTEPEEDKAAQPIPKVFSSEVGSTAQAVKLDVIYNGLFVSLWNNAITDYAFQKRLNNLVKPERFEYTRYAKEFSGEKTSAMQNLNKNYKQTRADIEKANAYYEEVREGIREEDLETLDALWETKIKEFEDISNAYFKYQNKYLNTYNQLVSFILKQGGSYYYQSATQSVAFYKFPSYKYFGETIDKLNKISFEQMKLLRDNAPPNFDLSSFTK